MARLQATGEDTSAYYTEAARRPDLHIRVIGRPLPFARRDVAKRRRSMLVAVHRAKLNGSGAGAPEQSPDKRNQRGVDHVGPSRKPGQTPFP